MLVSIIEQGADGLLLQMPCILQGIGQGRALRRVVGAVGRDPCLRRLLVICVKCVGQRTRLRFQEDVHAPHFLAGI